MKKDFLSIQKNIVTSMLKNSVGFSAETEQKLRIGIVSSFSEATGSSIVTSNLIRAIKNGIISAGGEPIELPIPSISNQLALASGLSAINNVSAKLISDSCEVITSIHECDGLVFVPFGISSIKGMLLASTKLNLPSLFVNVGPNSPCYYKNNVLTQSEIYKIVAQKFLGLIDEDEMYDLSNAYLPVLGEGEGMYSSNAMACSIEVLGLSLAGNGTAESGSIERLKLATDTGKAIVKVIGNQMVAKKILSKANFTNALTFTLATGGETETIGFLMELAKTCGYDFTLTHIAEQSAKTPLLTELYPLSNDGFFMKDLHSAGGVLAVLKVLYKACLINTRATNCFGESVETMLSKYKLSENNVIKNTSDAILPNNALTVLYGNLSEKGSLIKRSGIFKGLTIFSGYAAVFDEESDACLSIYSGRIKKGSVIVVRNCGKKGGPGMPELTFINAAICAAKLENDVAIITDGKASSLFNGLVVSEINPESYEGSILSIIQDDDVIDIDMVNQKLNLKINAKDINLRMRNFIPFERAEKLITDKFFVKR